MAVHETEQELYSNAWRGILTIRIERVVKTALLSRAVSHRRYHCFPQSEMDSVAV